MRQPLLVAVAAFVIASAAAPAGAQDGRPFLRAKGGWVWPKGEDFKDVFGSTWTAGADLGVRGKLLGIGVDGRFSRKKEQIDGTDVVADATWTSIPLSGNLYLNLFVDDAGSLYVAGGPSLVYTKIEGLAAGGDIATRFREGRWSWGWNVIVGADAGNTFIEGQYIWLEEDFGLAESPGVKLNTISVVLGYRF